jgi:major membrane immunogen (membrane-anchored lipoprotein)
MKKSLSLLLCLALLLGTLGASAQTLTGEAKGFGGPITVTVTVEDGKITAVEAVGTDETKGVGTPALEQLPGMIVEAGSPDVAVVSGATYTSEGIINAVKAALTGVAPAKEATPAPAKPVVIDSNAVFAGLGINNTGRIGPGKDNKDVQVYSFNQVFAGVLFDAEGKILYAKLDQLEVATPNYDGEGMPHFAGFPGQIPYTYDSDHNAEVDSTLSTSDDQFLTEVSGWQSKRARGESYKMGVGTWSSQMDAFESLFVGKTVAELQKWFVTYTSDRNGRPLKDGSTNAEDKAKYDALSAEDKAVLADVVTSATMSLNDGHGNILGALEDAYKKRVPVTASPTSVGLGLDFLGRLGPGKDSSETQVYSFNQVFTMTFFDAAGKIVQSLVDQVEVATPNYDGDGMPHFSGFPGQGGYNDDFNHDGVVEGKRVTTDAGFQAEVSSWLTKRERGESYKMGVGTWASQMDAYQALFAGKTVDELAAWFATYTSDRNGRPLKDGSTNEQDKAKYDALSAEDKAVLADVITGATMSLNDGHGNLLAALRNSFENKLPITLKLGK